MRSGWVGSDVWDKVPKKKTVFLTPSLIWRYSITMCWIVFRVGGHDGWELRKPTGYYEMWSRPWVAGRHLLDT